MIKNISSSLENFKNFEFTPGLNIIVAKRHISSGSKDTRNGTGKTSIIELIHFILAGKKYSDSDFHHPALANESFTLTLQNSKGAITKYSKSVIAGKEVARIDGRNVDNHKMRQEKLEEWFSLTPKIMQQKYSPNFNALFSLFARKQRIGGFTKATLNSSCQQGWDMQVNLSYLLGFDWHLPQKLQLTKDEKKLADGLKKCLKTDC